MHYCCEVVPGPLLKETHWVMTDCWDFRPVWPRTSYGPSSDEEVSS
jgi:hypothetical protein